MNGTVKPLESIFSGGLTSCLYLEAPQPFAQMSDASGKSLHPRRHACNLYAASLLFSSFQPQILRKQKTTKGNTPEPEKSMNGMKPNEKRIEERFGIQMAQIPFFSLFSLLSLAPHRPLPLCASISTSLSIIMTL